MGKDRGKVSKILLNNFGNSKGVCIFTYQSQKNERS